ncbi:hypothetical protein [Kalamiella sp. sgz302252]|uniref:hypothetical protein n=1 Tax=Pantoea sp. sgz302252 TaxID=3341827 RepID=UPI0036D399B7
MFNIGKTAASSAQRSNPAYSDSNKTNSNVKSFANKTTSVHNSSSANFNIKISNSSNVRIGNTYYPGGSSSGRYNSTSEKSTASAGVKKPSSHFNDVRSDKPGTIVISGKSNIHIGKTIYYNTKK